MKAILVALVFFASCAANLVTNVMPVMEPDRSNLYAIAAEAASAWQSQYVQFDKLGNVPIYYVDRNCQGVRSLDPHWIRNCPFKYPGIMGVCMVDRWSGNRQILLDWTVSKQYEINGRMWLRAFTIHEMGHCAGYLDHNKAEYGIMRATPNVMVPSVVEIDQMARLVVPTRYYLAD